MPDIQKVDYAVEANDYERQTLWESFHGKYVWQQEMRGNFFTIGELDKRPITICLDWAIINGKRVLFYHSPSQVVDHVLVEKWVKDNALNKNSTMTDPSNFHIVLHEIERST